RRPRRIRREALGRPPGARARVRCGQAGGGQRDDRRSGARVDRAILGVPDMKIALASPRVATSMDDALGKIERCLSDASTQGAEIVCFPEAYLPGLRGVDFDVLPFDRADQERV